MYHIVFRLYVTNGININMQKFEIMYASIKKEVTMNHVIRYTFYSKAR
jgi:hypothetical protein